jgi:predicted small lipoprotein YifL
MTKRSVLYIVVGIDLLYIATLAVCGFLIGPLYRPDFVAMRTKIEASSSLEDLRPRALHAIAAIKSGDRAIEHLHEVATHLIAFGIAVAIVNLLMLCFLVPRTVRV